MNYDTFLEWLLTEKKLSLRAAKDVVSRCKRICNMLNISVLYDSGWVVLTHPELCNALVITRMHFLNPLGA